MTLSRLTERAVKGASSVTQQTVSKEVLPAWIMHPLVADLTEKMCQVMLLVPMIGQTITALPCPFRDNTKS